MIECPKKYIREIKDVNAELSELKGFLNDKEAKISLAKFLRANIGFTTELISGVKLAAYQEMHIKAFLIEILICAYLVEDVVRVLSLQYSVFYNAYLSLIQKF